MEREQCDASCMQKASWACPRFLRLDELHISAEQHLLLRKVFSSTNFVRSNFHSFASLFENASLTTSFSEMSASVHFKSGSHQFPGCLFHFRGVSPKSNAVSTCWQRNVFVHCCVPQLLFNETLGAGLGVARSPF